jgi:hypothetical protein
LFRHGKTEKALFILHTERMTDSGRLTLHAPSRCVLPRHSNDTM